MRATATKMSASSPDCGRVPRSAAFTLSVSGASACRLSADAKKLEALSNQLHNLTDVAEIVRISAEHEVNVLPPEANQ